MNGIWEAVQAGANMGITPIVNLTPLTRSIEPDLEPLPMARVENSARTGDETYSPSNGKSARGSEDDATEDEFDDPLEDVFDRPCLLYTSRCV